MKRSIEDRLLTARTHRAALDVAMTQFPPAFSLDALEAAWNSRDAAKANQANALQGGFENVLNQLLEAAGELCRLEGWAHGDSMPVALRKLKEQGVITETVRKDLAGAKELWDGAQHAHPGVAAADFHEAVGLLIRSERDFAQDVQRWLAAHHP
ncbi:MAG TPA: hypothetical protein VN615_06580 [Gaiellales bacterium]|nr:hypothetical protein [Gaiellales bacterium]